jgi:hypothetical protein
MRKNPQSIPLGRKGTYGHDVKVAWPPGEVKALCAALIPRISPASSPTVTARRSRSPTPAR